MTEERVRSLLQDERAYVLLWRSDIRRAEGRSVMTVILNAPVVAPGLVVVCRASSFDEVLAAASGAASYVGHPATAEMLGLPCNRAIYDPLAGDVAFVVRLKGRRPVSGGDVQGVRPEDCEFLRLEYVDLSKFETVIQGDGYPFSLEDALTAAR